MQGSSMKTVSTAIHKQSLTDFTFFSLFLCLENMNVHFLVLHITYKYSVITSAHAILKTGCCVPTLHLRTC